MDEEQQQLLFKLLPRSENNTSNNHNGQGNSKGLKNMNLSTQGTGFSLFMTRQIVYQLGGDIICKSELGRGSEFTFVVALKHKQEMKEKRWLNVKQSDYKKFKIGVKDISHDYQA